MKIPDSIKIILSFSILLFIAAFVVFLLVNTGPVKELGLQQKEDDELVWVNGNVTNKFITGVNPLYYYFVIDDSFDICVIESLFYSYRVGDFFTGEIYMENIYE